MSVTTPQGRQRAFDILRFVVRFEKLNGYGPSLREVAEAVGLTSVGTVHDYLLTLRNEELVSWTPRLQRTLHSTERGREAVVQA